MNLPMPNIKIEGKAISAIMLGIMCLAALSYMLFLYASWHQFQEDRFTRDEKIDELLDRIPRPVKPKPAESED